jgi:ubiquinone/menaquinone biosynthesis C-methylase UbiE
MQQPDLPQHTRGVKTEAIFDTWNNFSFGYSDYLSRNFEALGIHMANLINIDKMGPGSKILELGCGDGTLAANLALMKAEDCELIACDLVPNMCRLTASRFDKLQEAVKTGKVLGARRLIFKRLSQDEVAEWPVQKCRQWPELKVSLYEANNEDLTPIFPNSNSVDGIIACLSLHIVNDPKKMLDEMFRVSKSQSKIGLTVWGSKQHAYFITLADEAAQKFRNKPLPPKSEGFVPPKDLWHLSDRDQLATLIKSSGFDDVIISEQQVHFLELAEAQRDLYIRRNVLDFAEDDSPEYHAAVAWIKSEQNRLMNQENRSIGMVFLLAVARKP